MTPYSSQSAPVPDRYISRLRHSQSRTRGKRVKDLKLRAIQISCTLFHPLQCMSLPLFSFWMTVSFFPSSYTYLFSLYIHYLLLSFTPFLASQFSSLNFSFQSMNSAFMIFSCEIGPFLSQVCSVSALKVCVREKQPGHVCL